MLLLPLLAGCLPEEPGRGVLTAEPAACLSGPLPIDGELGEVVVSGAAVAHGPVEGESLEHGVRCDNARMLLSVDDGADVWTIGYGWSEGGADVTPPMDVTPGASVQLTFRHVRSFGDAAGFVLLQEGVLVAALEVGAWGPALRGADVPGVRASEGQVTGSERDACGRKVARQVLFDGDEQLALEAIDSAPLRIDGNPTTAWALASWGWENLECTDLAGELSWAVFR